ncbi:MAG: FIST N-terminal domain-containing protein [Sandaracinaceae bacterium]
MATAPAPISLFAPTTRALRISRAQTIEPDSARAAAEIASQLGADPDVVFCFVSPAYDLAVLGAALASAFPEVLVVGCTTSGQVGSSGYQSGGITAAALGGVVVKSLLLEPLDQCVEDLDEFIARSSARLAALHGVPNTFGFLLADGLSMMEERLIAGLHAAAGEVPIVGGSAGDDLAFNATHVLHEGRFRSNAAVLTLVSCPTPFSVMNFAHHEPSDFRMAITKAIPDERLVLEIDGIPAAEAYASLVGVPVAELGPEVFSKHPVTLRVNDAHYIRSIQKVEPDGSIRFYCAIEEGLVLRLARPSRVIETLNESFDAAHRELGGRPDVVLGCDCILRRLELESMGMDDEVGALLARRRVTGFSTYGEQLNGVHVNQTFVGVALRSNHG